MSQASALASQFGVTMPFNNSNVEWAYPEIIKSRPLAKAVLNRKFSIKNLDEDIYLFEILMGTKQNIEDKKTEVLAIENFHQMVELDENRVTGIYTISISGRDPTLVRDINAVLIEELDKHQSSYNTRKIKETKIFIESRIEATEFELSNAEEKLKRFRDRNRRIGNSPNLQLEEQRLSRDVSVLTGVFTSLKQQLETTKIEELRKSEYIIIIDPPQIPISPSAPKKKIAVVFAGVFGLFLGLIFAFIKEATENIDDVNRIKIEKIKNILYSKIPKGILKLFS